MKYRRVIALSLVLLMLIAFAGCGKTKDDEQTVQRTEESEKQKYEAPANKGGSKEEEEEPMQVNEELASDPKHEHKYVIDERVEPTCQHTGLTEGMHCAECGKVLIAQEVLPMVDHYFAYGECLWCGETDPDYSIGGEVGDSGGILLPEVDA